MRVALFVGVALVVLLLAFGVYLQESRMRVNRDTALATGQVYAQHVGLFCQASNRLPNSASELADYVFGNTNWPEQHTFDVVDESKKVFCIGTSVGVGKTVRMQFQLSPTGAVLQTVSPP